MITNRLTDYYKAIKVFDDAITKIRTEKEWQDNIEDIALGEAILAILEKHKIIVNDKLLKHLDKNIQ